MRIGETVACWASTHAKKPAHKGPVRRNSFIKQLPSNSSENPQSLAGRLPIGRHTFSARDQTQALYLRKLDTGRKFSSQVP